jgi:hypothetical protein
VVSKLLFSLLVSAGLFMQASWQPVYIPIQNASFEDGTTGWNFSGGGGVLNVSLAFTPQ